MSLNAVVIVFPLENITFPMKKKARIVNGHPMTKVI